MHQLPKKQKAKLQISHDIPIIFPWYSHDIPMIFPFIVAKAPAKYGISDPSATPTTQRWGPEATHHVVICRDSKDLKGCTGWVSTGSCYMNMSIVCIVLRLYVYDYNLTSYTYWICISNKQHRYRNQRVSQGKLYTKWWWVLDACMWRVIFCTGMVYTRNTNPILKKPMGNITPNVEIYECS